MTNFKKIKYSAAILLFVLIIANFVWKAINDSSDPRYVIYAELEILPDRFDNKKVCLFGKFLGYDKIVESAVLYPATLNRSNIIDVHHIELTLSGWNLHQIQEGKHSKLDDFENKIVQLCGTFRYSRTALRTREIEVDFITAP